ncbi:MAG: hypothetical protein H6R17_1514 [Proteobacteria bacterium]|nr:hypothetical protein [Pseudomonadota bacterium]
MRILLIAALLLAGIARAELPPPPSYLGEIKRNDQGQLVVIESDAGGGAAKESPPALPAPSAPAPPSVAAVPRAVAPAARPDARAEARPAAAERSAPQCARHSITCVEVVATGERTQASVPLTFGQPFRIGDLAKGGRLLASDGHGRLPLQIDETASHADGSLAFAVLSTQIADLKPGEKRIINLARDNGEAARPAAAPPPAPASLDLKLAATVYSPQISQITFGDRNGNIQGIPFAAGEEITLQLGDAPDERFTLTVTPELAGGQFTTLTKIAESFRDLVNRRSRGFRADKPGEGGGYEKLWIATRTPDGAAFAVKFIYSGKAKLSSRNLQEHRAPRQFVALTRPALERALADHAAPRLLGPVAREYTLVVPFTEVGSGKLHPQLSARLHARFLDNNQRVRTDLVLENDWAYAAEPGNLTYDLLVTQGDKTLLRQAAFTHHHHARWHRVLWTTGDAPQAQVRHNMPYFLDSKATWNYDLSLKIPESVLADEAARLAKTDAGPMGGAALTQYFPMTGGRPDIGPLPRWTALYLISQDRRAEAAMLANADAAATIPVHYRDSASDQPVNLDRHPGLALRSGQSTAKDAMPATANGETPWTVDVSHQASFAFIPYLISGDAFYLDETLFWAAWNMFSINPDYREHEKGLVHPEQIRGQAWALRSIADAAYALPDRHPEKAYYSKRLSTNLAWYAQSAASAAGPIRALEQSDKPGLTAPWQNDFMALVVGLISERQDASAEKYFAWLSRFTVGRFTNEAQGFCRSRAPGYWIKIRDAKSQAPYKTWHDVYQANWPDDPACAAQAKLDGYPEAAGGYVANARAMLAVSASLGVAQAAQAYDWLSASAPGAVAAMDRDPTWAIVPRAVRGRAQ